MELPLQLHGTVESSAGTLAALLCRDADRPDEAMVHWWGADIPPGAVLARFDEPESGRYRLQAQLLFECDQNGRLMPAPWRFDAKKSEQRYGCDLALDNNKLCGTWNVNGVPQGAVLFQAPPDPLRLPFNELADWAEFKSWADTIQADGKFVDFRGHGSHKFTLTTSLARVDRTRLERFNGETLMEFWAHAEAVLSTRFDPRNSADMSTVLALAQHHGLPTPLLDWTKSPYIAAFFAFADALENEAVRPEHTHVRIFALSRAVSEAAIPEICLPFYQPYYSYLAVGPRLNPRLYAQQGRFLVTNIADLEHYLCGIQALTSDPIVTAVDVPIKCARTALGDLRFMGLNAATMYPGLDGVCKMLRHEIACKKRES